MTLEVHVTIHGDLSDDDLGQLRSLFDHEYLADHGAWTPTDPYGYSGAQVHVTAYDGARLVGHVGFQPRVITVGDERVTVAGTGGVLVADSRRGTGLGRRLMHEAQLAMRHDPAIEFGYLGCRPDVVPFYESAGWHRVTVMERHLSRQDPSATTESADSPILICPISRPISRWPSGTVDLHGTPW